MVIVDDYVPGEHDAGRRRGRVGAFFEKMESGNGQLNTGSRLGLQYLEQALMQPRWGCRSFGQ